MWTPSRRTDHSLPPCGHGVDLPIMHHSGRQLDTIWTNDGPSGSRGGQCVRARECTAHPWHVCKPSAHARSCACGLCVRVAVCVALSMCLLGVYGGSCAWLVCVSAVRVCLWFVRVVCVCESLCVRVSLRTQTRAVVSSVPNGKLSIRAPKLFRSERRPGPSFRSGVGVPNEKGRVVDSGTQTFSFGTPTRPLVSEPGRRSERKR